MTTPARVVAWRDHEDVESEVAWPWNMSDQGSETSSRPWVFRPVGFLVAVLGDTAAAESGRAALREAGFAERDLRIYAGDQVLDERERFLAQQHALRRVVENLTSETEMVELFVKYARDGRSFLWVHVPDRDDANRAIGSLATLGVLHYRYYGKESLEDIHVR